MALIPGLFGGADDTDALSPLFGGPMPSAQDYALSGGLQAIAPLMGPQRAPVGMGQVLAALGGGMTAGQQQGQAEQMKRLLTAYQLQKAGREDAKATKAEAQVEEAAKQLEAQGKAQEAAWLRSGGVPAFNEYMKTKLGNEWVPLGGGAVPGVTAPVGGAPAGVPSSGGTATPAVKAPEVFNDLVVEHAVRTGVPAPMINAVIMQESGGNPNAVSPKGAQGVMQLMPGTSRDPGFGVQPARDASPEENIRVGVDYLAAMRNRYKDDKLALAAYNWGPDNVDKWVAAGADPSKLPTETQNYVTKIAGSPLGARTQVADAGNVASDGWRTIFNRKTGKLLEVSPDGTQMRKPKSEATLGLTPIYGKDENGNDIILQLGDDGRAVKTPLPSGVTLTNGAQKVDLGTEWGVMDRNGNLIGRIPKDVAGVEVQKGRGESQAKREADAPKSIQQADAMLASIDGVLNDPGLAWGTGNTSWLQNLRGSKYYDFSQRVDQLKGQAFLQAFDNLKGAGQITEVEGKKATDAIARLDTGQSEKAFRAALTDLRNVVIAARERAKKAVPDAGAAQATPQQPAPQPSAPTATAAVPALPPGFQVLE